MKTKLCFLGLLLTFSNCWARNLPTAKITVRVMDENQEPIQDADVKVTFRQGGDAWKSEHIQKKYNGRSDSNGLFSATSTCDGDFAYYVSKDGYYKSWEKGYFRASKVDSGQTWNEVKELVLREIKNPIPLYHKNVSTKIPKPNIEYGYDLFVGDWVSPLGSGKVADFKFKVSGFWKSRRDYDSTLTLSFLNKGDGLTEFLTISKVSDFKSPYYALGTGFQAPKIWRKFRRKATQDDPHDQISATGEIVKSDYDSKANYFFRVRTKYDKDGKVESAYYGKIYGDIKFGGASEDGCYLIFTYYLNPISNDRNIEFDPDKNLFGGNDKFAP